MLDHLHYALALGFCLLVTLPLELLGAGVYRRPRRLLAALAVPAVIFIVWDAAAAARGHWSYDPAQLIEGPRLAGLPVEELLFFVVVPTCAILTLEAVRGIRSRVSVRTAGATRA